MASLFFLTSHIHLLSPHLANEQFEMSQRLNSVPNQFYPHFSDPRFYLKHSIPSERCGSPRQPKWPGLRKKHWNAFWRSPGSCGIPHRFRRLGQPSPGSWSFRCGDAICVSLLRKIGSQKYRTSGFTRLLRASYSNFRAWYPQKAGINPSTILSCQMIKPGFLSLAEFPFSKY